MDFRPQVVSEAPVVLASPMNPLRGPFGPSSVVPGLAYPLLRLSALECLMSLADSPGYYALC
jgi:hypothetical protein